MDSCSLLLYFLDYISTFDHSTNVINYVAIGCANRQTLKPNIKDTDVIELLDSENQQYPLFLRKIKQQHPNISINLFLIDEKIEHIPVCIRKHKSADSSEVINELETNWIIENKFKMGDIYSNTTEKIKIFTIKSNVYYEPLMEGNGQQNITRFLEILNCISKTSNWLTFVTDFSGRTNMQPTKVYFHEELIGYKHKIVYGLFSDINQLCLKDMTSVDFYFVSNENGLSIFNPENFENMLELVECVEFLTNSFEISGDFHSLALVMTQLKGFIDDIILYIKNVLCPLIRQSMISINGTQLNMIIPKQIKYHDEFVKKLEERDYFAIYIMAINELEICLSNIYCCIHKTKNEKKIKEIIESINHISDPYKLLDFVIKEINTI